MLELHSDSKVMVALKGTATFMHGYTYFEDDDVLSLRKLLQGAIEHNKLIWAVASGLT